MHKSFCLPLILAICFAPALFARPIGDPMGEEENLYRQVADVELMIDGNPTRLSSIYQNSPVIIAEVFTRCTGVCSPSLLRLKENLEGIDASRKYMVIVVSFDPRDTAHDLHHMAHMLSVDKEPRWLFATTRQIDELNRSIGFHAQWDESRGQYEHDALLTGIDRRGIIKRKLLGLRDQYAVSELISEINGGFTPSYPLPAKNRIFSCFHYDSSTGRNRLGTGFLVMLAPGLFTIALIGLLGMRARR